MNERASQAETVAANATPKPSRLTRLRDALRARDWIGIGIELAVVTLGVLLVLGLVAAASWRLGATASAALVGAFAVFHGLAHGAELGGGAALVGMVLATALLHAGGLALGLKLRALAPVWSRAAGGAIALLGLGLLTRLVIA